MAQTPAQRRAAAARKKAAAETAEYYEWDELVSEAHIDQPPFKLRVPVLPPEPDAKGKVPEVDPEADTHELIEIPIPSGASYINLVNSQASGNVAGVLVNLTTSTKTIEEGNELFMRLMALMEKADFPIVERLATRVIKHYFNAPPKAADGSEGGAGE